MLNRRKSVLLRLLVLLMALSGVRAFAQKTDAPDTYGTHTESSQQDLYGTQNAPQSIDQRPAVPVRSEAGFPIAGSSIYPGDLLDITTFGVPELTTRTRVSREGDIYLPLIG